MRSHDELHTVAFVAIANVIRNADSVAGVRIGGAVAAANVWSGLAGQNSSGLTPCPTQRKRKEHTSLSK